MGQGADDEHELHLGAALDGRGRQHHHQHRKRVRGRRQHAEERRPVFLAPQAPRHGVGCVGTAVVSRSKERAGIRARRLVDRPDVRVPERPAVGHAKQRRSRPGRRSQRHRARRQEGRTVHLRREAVRGQLQHHHRPVRPPVVLDRLWLHAAVLPDSAGVPAAHRELPLRRVPASQLLGSRHERRQDDADHREDALPAAHRGVQHFQQPDVRRAAVHAGHRLVRLRTDQQERQRGCTVQLPAVRAAGLQVDVVASRAGRLLQGLPVLLALAPFAPAARAVAWPDLPPASHARLAGAGVSASTFDAFLSQLQRTHAQRVREGDLDHLVFYLLQSTHFTRQPAIEPALSARALVESLDAAPRSAYLQNGRVDESHVGGDVRARVRDLLRALDATDQDPRLVYFRQLAAATLPHGREREAAVLHEYLRAMRFLYEKEFAARRPQDPADAVAALYRSRGLSTDTAIEAGYAVHLGLGMVRSLEPARRIRRVLIVGPGLDLAPRTALIDAAAPESYQPWTVLDALVGLGLSRLEDVEVVCADINPRVVAHLQHAHAAPPTLTLISGLHQSPQLTLQDDYRTYFAGVGKAISLSDPSATTADDRLVKVLRTDPAAARRVSAVA